MSYLVFGTFTLARALDDAAKKAVAYDLVECAVAQRLYLLLGCNIVQPGIIHEMLGYEQGVVPDDKLLFLLTDSPISDTSDDLISPYHVGLDGSDSSLIVSLSRIGRLLKATMDFADVGGVEIVHRRI